MGASVKVGTSCIVCSCTTDSKSDPLLKVPCIQPLLATPMFLGIRMCMSSLRTVTQILVILILIQYIWLCSRPSNTSNTVYIPGRIFYSSPMCSFPVESLTVGRQKKKNIREKQPNLPLIIKIPSWPWTGLPVLFLESAVAVMIREVLCICLSIIFNDIGWTCNKL